MGYIVVITGTDGCGKQTQTERLYERLSREGYNVRMQSLPNYDSPSSAPVQMYLSGEFGDDPNCLDAYQASSLYAVDRLCTYNRDLKDFYENGGIILFDRYVDSNMLHQACKFSDRAERDKCLDWLNDLEFGKLQLPRPNRTIFLDVPVDVSMALARARGKFKNKKEKDILENDYMHMCKAYEAGKYVSKKYSWTDIACTINNEMRTIDDIGEEIYSKVIEDIKNYGGKNGN